MIYSAPLQWCVWSMADVLWRAQPIIIIGALSVGMGDIVDDTFDYHHLSVKLIGSVMLDNVDTWKYLHNA